MKCPKCKKKCEELYIQQEFTTSVLGTKYPNGKIDYDLDAGYSQLWDWLDNMLMEKGKPKIVGCNECFS